MPLLEFFAELVVATVAGFPQFAELLFHGSGVAGRSYCGHFFGFLDVGACKLADFLLAFRLEELRLDVGFVLALSGIRVGLV
jgi:hypothetical protein